MDKKLEEAIKFLKNFVSLFYEFPNPQSVSIKDSEIKNVETVLNYIDNSISKEKIEKIFETKIYNRNYLASTDWTEHQREVDLEVANLLKIIKEELLEGK